MSACTPPASADDAHPAVTLQARPAGTWRQLDRIADVRLAEARDVTSELRSGPMLVDLPWTAMAAGTRVGSLVIGEGWVELVPAEGPAVHFDAAVPVAKTKAARAPAGELTRVDVLSGDGVALGPTGVARLLVRPDGVAIRWAGLSTPKGSAHAEMLLSRTGDVTCQYLSLPSGIEADVDAGRVHAGTRSLPLRPSSTSAWQLGHAGGLDLDPPRAEPKASGPPPTGCVGESGTWCDRADGPGSSTLYVQNDFDGGYNVGGLWTTQALPGKTDLWHLTTYAACPPGALGTQGQSVYFGDDPTCQYLPRSGGSLLSPFFGPVTASTQFIWSSRIAWEDGFDTAELYVNGTLIGTMPAGLDPTLWYNFNPISLGPWAGQVVQVEFRFDADNSVQDLGWMVDDFAAWDPLGPSGVDCIRSAGFGDYTNCDQTVSDRWDFYEGAFCQDCPYVFYVLVECGREMHIPLSDMEGGEISVTNVITGNPVSLHCINSTAVADAGGGPYSGLLLPNDTGAALDCCPGGGPETWWGPAFDETDNNGPGSVTWGFDTGCQTFLAYDRNGSGGLDCGEVPPTCGGLLSLISPGDVQIMDCYLQDDNGLCGLYRVDVRSGGFAWSLFANCDGTGTPQFQIFHDCTDAWTAYNPLPELAIANLSTANGCPNLDVTFDVVNLGCVDFPNDVPIRIVSNCTPPDTLDTVVTGPIAAGAHVTVTVPFGAACSPVRVEVFADPDDIIPECTEALTVAACRTIPGVDSLATFTCGCTAQLTAAAGADVAACPGARVTLNANGSSIAPCTTPEYRWLDSVGGILRDWDVNPQYAVNVGGCPGGREYVLEIRCQGEACVETDRVRVDCIVVQPNAGPDVMECIGTSVTLDASGTAITNCPAREYRWFDPLGFEIRSWSGNPILNLGPLTCAAAGTYTLEVRCSTDDTCTDIDDVTVACVEVQALAGPDLYTCEGDTFDISLATSTRRNCTASVYQWFDDLGNPLTAPSSTPGFSGSVTNCPGTVSLVLVAACVDAGFETCGTFDLIDIICPTPNDPTPTATPDCGITSLLDCGVPDPGVGYYWDTDILVDSDSDGDPANDIDAIGCLTLAGWPTSGSRTVRAFAEESINGCRTFADVVADSFDDPPAPVPGAVPACAGADSQLLCGIVDPTLTYSWDTDVAVDSDSSGNPDDDADVAGCDVVWAYPSGGRHTAKVTATDVRGCTSSATVDVDVTGGGALPEVLDDRATKTGTSLTLTWSAVISATSYRIARGDIGAWYSHAADDPIGRGVCDTGPVLTWSDPDDLADSGDYYYLITALAPCTSEGSPGDQWNHVAFLPRDARLPTGSCP